MYTYPEEFIIRPPFLPTDEEYGVLPGFFSPLCLRAERTLKLSPRGSLLLVAQAPHCLYSRHHLYYRSIGACIGTRSGREDKAFSGKNVQCLNFNPPAVVCACAIMNYSGKYIYIYFTLENIISA